MEAFHLRLRLESIWWIVTALVVVMVLLPVWQHVPEYPFYGPNILYIAIFITCTRYVFLLRHTLIARMLWPKVAVIAGSAITVFILVLSLGDFNNYLVEEGLQDLVADLPVSRQYKMMRYIQGQMIFFGMGSAISAAALSVRMLISIWRMRNRGTV